MNFKPVLFLDRDGVVNVEKDYLYKIEDFEFIDGIFELCHYYQNLGYLIIIITNQSGIARGYYKELDFNILTKWMISEFLKQDILIAKVYHCPHHPNISGECSCRKPNTGMIDIAKIDFHIDIKNSCLVGDKERDIEAGINSGIENTFLFNEYKNQIKSKAKQVVHNLYEIRI